MEIRNCRMAGMFYPKEPGHLEQVLEMFFKTKTDRLHPLALLYLMPGIHIQVL
jgi:hypothetical protein